MRHFSSKYLNDCNNKYETDLLNSSDEDLDDEDYGYNNKNNEELNIIMI